MHTVWMGGEWLGKGGNLNQRLPNEVLKYSEKMASFFPHSFVKMQKDILQGSKLCGVCVISER